MVDLSTGELVTDRIKLRTPKGGEPDDIVATAKELLDKLEQHADGLAVGVCFPAVVKNGRTMSAANVSKKWIGLEAEKLFEKAARPRHPLRQRRGCRRLRRGALRCGEGRRRASSC